MSKTGKSRQRVLGGCLMTLCAMSYAVMSATTKASGKYLPSAEIALVRFIFQILICIIWSSSYGLEFRGIDARWLALRGGSGACAIMLLFYGLTLVLVGDGIALYSLYPVWSSIIAWRCLGEPFGVSLACSLFLSIGGTALITYGQQHSGNNVRAGEVEGWLTHRIRGYVAIVVGSFFASLEIISCRLLKDANAMLLTASVSTMGTFASASKLAYDATGVNLVSIPSEGIASLVGVCLSGFAAVQLLNTSAQLLEAGPVTIIGASEIVWAYLLQIIFFGEVPSLIVIIGAMSVVCGAVVPGLQCHEDKGMSRMPRELLLDSGNS